MILGWILARLLDAPPDDAPDLSSLPGLLTVAVGLAVIGACVLLSSHRETDTLDDGQSLGEAQPIP